jgi:hypothetical protein
VTSNTGNDLPVRSTSMLINDPRQGLDGGSCMETTEVSQRISLADLQKTLRFGEQNPDSQVVKTLYTEP